jgi:hypothetical protein
LHARLWVHWAPGIPHALFGAELDEQLGRNAPRECGVIFRRHSGAMRSIELGISRFPDVQLHICGLVLTQHPGMTAMDCFASLAKTVLAV